MATKLAAITAAIGTGIGGVLGFFIGGSAMVSHGAKIGCGLGIKVAVANRAPQIVSHGKKIGYGLDIKMAAVAEMLQTAAGRADFEIKEYMEALRNYS